MLPPLGAYQVSGEHAMIKFAAQAGALERRVVRATLGAFKRAGADLILSYFTRDVLREGFQTGAVVRLSVEGLLWYSPLCAITTRSGRI